MIQRSLLSGPPGRRVSRRVLLRGTAAGAGAAAIAGVAASTRVPFRSRAAFSARSGAASPSPGTAREFTLIAEEFEQEIMPGMTTRCWGYNGQTPGPEIRVREGDLVRIVLRNHLPVPTTIHWHGVHLTPEMDGPAGLNQAAVDPGGEFTYEFIATPPGTRWYHSHADPALQVPMGLYGPLIIEPATPARPYTYDREYTMILGEWDSELTPEVAAGTASRGPKDKMLRGGELGGDMFLINGKAHGGIAPIVIAKGDRVLLRMINAGHIPHPVHIHGHSFKIVATDGNPVPEGMEWVKDTVLIGPAERYDLELVGDNPGVWMFHCHIEHHMANGMMTVLQYEGHTPTGPAAEFFDLVTGDGSSSDSGAGSGSGMGHDHHGGGSQSPGTPSPTPANAGSSGPHADIAMLDDRFEPKSLTVTTGTTVTWTNEGADWHSLAAYDGSFDSGKLPPGGSFSHLFIVAGTFEYICQHHGLQGMLGQITVVDG